MHELVESEAGKELGHPAVSIYGGETHVMLRPEEFGYGFFEENYDGPVQVDWTVVAQLWAIDSEGDAIEEVGHTGRFLKTIDAAHQPHIGLTPPNRRGSTASIWDSNRTARPSAPTPPTSSSFRPRGTRGWP